MSFYALLTNYNRTSDYHSNLQMDYQGPELTLPSFDCEAELVNSDLWQDFYKIGTEMIITKNGRCMFPVLNVCFHGLEEGVQYDVSVELRPTGDGRWTRAGGQWAPTSPNHQNSQMTPIISVPHSMSPSLATMWSQPFKFNNLKLTNNQYDMSGNVVLKSMHRYLPVLKIRRLGSRPAERCFSFPETEFIAVTAYQNHDVAQLKIDKNPYAKGFRERERKRSKQKRQNSSTSPIEEVSLSQIKPLDCTLTRAPSSSSESISPSSTPEIFISDSPAPSESPKSSYPIYHHHQSHYAQYLPPEWTSPYMYNELMQRTVWYQHLQQQWSMTPSWHAPVPQKTCNDENKPKGSSFTIRAILQKN